MRIVGVNDISELSGGDPKTVDVDEDAGAEDEMLGELCDKITLAAGVTAKDKRLKDALTESLREENIKRMKKASDKGVEAGKNNIFSSSCLSSSTILRSNVYSFEERNYSAPKLTLWAPTESKYVNVYQELTISQMLQLLADKGDELETPIIKFSLVEQREEAIPDENKSKSERVRANRIVVCFLRTNFVKIALDVNAQIC